MNKTRLEAFSDGVIAILITIMVLELKVPHAVEINGVTVPGDTFDAIWDMKDIFLAYVLSFVNLGIYWNNHHHMLQATRKVNGKILWANLNLLFWLSLFPFATAWMGENHFSTIPMAGYGCVLVLAAISYTLLQTTIVKHDAGGNELLAEAIGRDLKGKLSLACYVLAIPLAFVNRWIAGALFVLVSIMWFIPDRRIEKKINE